MFDAVFERWVGWRNRLLASPRFQHFATRFPLFRPVAQVRARELFDLVAGFTYAQTLAACIDSGLIEMLADAPLTTAEVESRTGLMGKGGITLLRAAAALKLVESLPRERWTLGTAGAALRGNPGIAEMVAHHRLLYADLADPLALLRRGGGGGELARYWAYAEAPGEGDSGAVDAYSRLMAASQPLVAQQVIDAYRFDRHQRMLDIGGGEGAFVKAVGAAFPQLERGVFDLPAVVARLGPGVAAHGGDFLAGPIPRGHDLVTLVRVLHDHDDVPAAKLLRNIFDSLSPGDTLLIAEPMAQTRGAARMGDAYFGLYLLAMGSGRPRSVREISAMLHAAGFARVRRIRTAMPITVSMIVATR